MLSSLLSGPLPVGAVAPDFSLPDQDGNTVRLSDLRGRNVVLVFYPGDDTPGCTKQLCAFRDKWADAKAKKVAVFGVNPWSAEGKARFRSKFSFPFPLLVDKGQRVGKLYHTTALIVLRTVYLVGPDGIIRGAQRGMPDPDVVLAAAG